MTVTDEGHVAYGCNPRVRCSATQDGWNKGCRHPGAIQAHEEWLAARRADREDAVNWPEGQCLARRHGTRYAADIYGCRCPEALRKVKEDRERRDAARNESRARAYATEYHRETQRVQRATGGRLSADPRREWRYGKAGVSSITVMMMLHGFPDNPTRGERMVAIIKLDDRMVRDEWTARMRPMLKSEIGARIGCTEATVRRLRAERERRRGERALRRLADAQWRAAHHARGAERCALIAQETARHASAHEAKRARQVFYARTWRRMERARARARYH